MAGRSPIRVLNVAEKPSVAKSVAEILSRRSGGFRSREGRSRYNRIFEFEYSIRSQPCHMLVTSVTGHLMELDFDDRYRKWHSCDPADLYTAPVKKFVPQDKLDIKRTLEEEARRCQWLVLWLDCDREGENIAFEVVEVCTAVNHHLDIWRARFSALIDREIHESVQNLVRPNKLFADAVDARQEIDLRIGASFTRFQTMLLKDAFVLDFAGDDRNIVLSYGPCQFPTLGFIVERYWETQSHENEEFWTINCSHTSDEGTATFNWIYGRFFDYTSALIVYEMCHEEPTATVQNVRHQEKRKYPPYPLSTVELQKRASRYFRMSSEHTMKVAEELYMSGFISYPRTETDSFSVNTDLKAIVRDQVGHPIWGSYAQQLLDREGRLWRNPSNGGHDDKAHPPIHPTKFSAGESGWSQDHNKLYELVVRHFLACVSEPAVGAETTVDIDIAGQLFSASGCVILAKNYLDIYRFDSWGGSIIPTYVIGQQFLPTTLTLDSGVTRPPPLLSEADLLSCMDKAGIGTDATMHDHIKKLLDRHYAAKDSNTRFSPTNLETSLELQDVEAHDISNAVADSELSPEGKAEEKAKDKEEKDKEKGKEDKDKPKEKDTEKKGENEKEKGKALDGTSSDALLQRLPGCVSRDLIDQLTVEFCYLNSKSNRKKLVRALFNVPRTSLELLPYYSRLVATLSTCMKDVPTMLLSMLEEDFNFLINKKDQTNIETKIKNIRFIGELCKFKIAPAGLVFSCLKACLDDFNHHNIDVACNLLETCGRFLYRSPETTIRMANMLEILMRLKNVKNLDPRHSTLVENAYYLCKPPERSARISKIRPPLHQYIRKLLFSDLDKSSVEHVLRQLRKLPWSECEPYILKCFLKVHKGKYGQVHLIAFLTASLSRYHDEFAVAVVDEVLEEIRLGLELNDYSMQQRRIAYMRFLGELYNYEHIDSSVIFETLYLIIIFGNGTPEQDVLDPPEDCFRIRMIITLLQTCGHYFDRGSSKRKLDRFLIYFQRYVLSKGPLPLDIEFDIQDMFAELRPKMTRYSSIEEVNATLIELEEHERTASADKISGDKHSDSESHKPSSQTARSATVIANGRSAANGGVEENGKGHDEAADSESYSDTGSIDPEGHEDEEELLSDDKSNDGSDGDDEDDSVHAAGSDEDDSVQVRQKVVEVDPREEEDFDRELRALMQESLDSRKLDLRARPTLNMMIPMNIFEGPTKDPRAVEGESGEETVDEEGGSGSGGSTKVRVKVLVKKGNKQQMKQMYIPKECSLIQSTKQKEAEELEEKQSIKRRILEYNEREEEELNGISSPGSGWLQAGGGNSGVGTSSRPVGRGNYDGVGRAGGYRQQRHHSTGGFYHGYGRRR